MKKKITIEFGIAGFLAIVLTTVLISLNYYQLVKTQASESLEVYCEALAQNQDLTDEVKFAGEVLNDKIRVTLIEKDGTVLYDSQANASKMENHLGREEVEDALREGSALVERRSDTVEHKTLYYAIKLDNDRVLRVGMQINSVFYLFKEAMPITIAISLILIILYLVISYVIIRKIVSPIAKVAENLDQVQKKDIYEELRPFAEKIRSQNKMRAEFTANVSHELKTPLTSIVGYSQLVESGIAKGEDIQKFATKIDEEANRLLSLINDILKLSKLDESDGDTVFEQVNLLEIAKHCKKRLELKAAEKGIAFSVVGEELEVEGVGTMIEEMIYNLCDNSIRYNNQDGVLIVSIYKRGKHTILSVKDNGIGIPKDHQEHIFERFYRVDKSHSKETGGTGLGLSIVKHIAIYHKASIELESEPGNGTEIKVVF